MNLDTLARRALLATGAGLLMLGAGCGTSPAVRLRRLPLAAPEPASPATAAAAADAIPLSGIWEVAMRPTLPAYLDREEILVDRGQGRVEPLPGERWAEPLAEAVPRLLLHDLALLRGTSRVWPAPAPTAVGARQRLRVQVLGLQAEPAAGVLRLQARWTLEDASQGAPPQVGQVDVDVPLNGADAASVVAAHRLALWRLAQRIAAGATP